jgi:3-oxoacyl-[acyl-carrier protein] reductase
MRTIRDKVALVTGAASGFGRAIARRLASEGARLHLADCKTASLEMVAAEIHATGTPVAISTVDLAHRAGVEALSADVLQRWGGVDILVNNAGIAWYGPTLRMTEDEWDRLLAVNLDAPMHLTRRLLRSLLSRPEAHVINMASVGGWVCGGRFAAYHVSKFGLVGFSEALRAEFNRQGLGVTAVCPGPVLTDLYRNAGCGYGDRQSPQPPAWLCTTAENVAAKTVRAIYRNQAISLVGGAAYLLYYGKRLAPSVFYALHGIGRAKNLRQKEARASTNVNREVPPQHAPAA